MENQLNQLSQLERLKELQSKITKQEINDVIKSKEYGRTYIHLPLLTKNNVKRYNQFWGTELLFPVESRIMYCITIDPDTCNLPVMHKITNVVGRTEQGYGCYRKHFKLACFDLYPRDYPVFKDTEPMFDKYMYNERLFVCPQCSKMNILGHKLEYFSNEELIEDKIKFLENIIKFLGR